jgi:hypothetical protein
MKHRHILSSVQWSLVHKTTSAHNTDFKLLSVTKAAKSIRASTQVSGPGISQFTFFSCGKPSTVDRRFPVVSCNWYATDASSPRPWTLKRSMVHIVCLWWSATRTLYSNVHFVWIYLYCDIELETASRPFSLVWCHSRYVQLWDGAFSIILIIPGLICIHHMLYFSVVVRASWWTSEKTEGWMGHYKTSIN